MTATQTLFKSTRTPTVIQMENVECGAAALGIILGYYRRIVPLTELRQQCGVSRDGSKASNMLKAARHYGMEAKGFRMPVEKLKEATLPCIVFWGFNHFLVVEKFGRHCVFLNDPASGRRSVSYEEFSASYTGIVLILQPGEDFECGGKKETILSSLLSRLKFSKWAIAFCLLAGLLLTLPRLAIPAFTQVFVDEVLVQNRQNWLRPLLLGMIITALSQGLVAKLRLTYLRRLLIKLSVSMSGHFLWYTLRLPVGFYAQRYAGEISNRTPLNDKVANVVTGQLATTVIDMVMLIFYGAIMFMYDRVLTVIAIAFASLNLITLKLLSDSRKDSNSKLAQEQGKSVGVAIGGLLSIESVKASGLESDLFSKFSGYYAKLINAQREAAIPNLLLASLPSLLSAIATTTILVVGGFRVMGGNLTIGMLVAYQSLSQSFLGPINTLMGFGGTLQTLEADLNRLDDVLKNPLDPETQPKNENLSPEEPQPLVATSIRTANIRTDNTWSRTYQSGQIRLEGDVELRHLSFGYSPLTPPLIEDFNLHIQPGQRIALVGGSGSGKSTVAKLITGLYQPWQGDILLDQVPRQQIPRSVLANSLAMVEQDIFLFAGTVRENLTLWDSTIRSDRLMQACKDAMIHDLILSLPGGYDAELIEGGMNISGGQRQRLEIARALVRNPSVLVLDEATSALDAETELQIDRNLRRRGCACIVVAHRLSTIRDCDEIIVLEKGRVVQRGNHEDLRHQEGTYQRLVLGSDASSDIV